MLNMEYGEAKWIIYPIGVKVRLMKPDDWEEIWDKMEKDYPLDHTDYAGVEHLKQRLDEIEYTSNGDDLLSWQVEPLDPDWKTKHLDHLRDEYGDPECYENWLCEKDSSNSWDDLIDYCKEKYYNFIIEHNPGAKKSGWGVWEGVKDRPSQTLQKQWASEFCNVNGLGRVIPYFLAQYEDDVKWIESHLAQTIEVKKPDGRGKNPNSLKNLKQFREKEVTE